ncbi:MAG: trigger factor [Candidatus Zixiibacteriota bacterium]
MIKSEVGLKREIEVEVPTETVDAAFAEVYHKFAKDVKIKGFRPGKVPMHVIKSKYGEAIKEEILHDLVEKTYPEAVKEHDLKVASLPDIVEFDIKEGNPLHYTAKVEVMPDINSINLDELKLPEQKLDVSDTEVDLVVKYLRKKTAEFKTVEREAKAEDMLVLDLEKASDPKHILPDTGYNDTEIDLDSENTMPEFKEKLVGMKVGEERTVDVEYPEHFANKMLAGAKIGYKCKLKEVKERILPEENDAFAKAASEGKVETMLELRLKIREDIQRQKEQDQRQWQKRELMQQVIDKNKIDVPEAMVEKYIESALEEMKKENPKIDEGGIREYYQPIAEEAIRWNFLTDYLTEQEKIEVLASDTEKWIKSFAESYQMEMDKAKDLLSKTGKINEIRNSLLEEKIFDFLMTKVTYVPEEARATITAEGDKSETENKDDAAE